MPGYLCNSQDRVGQGLNKPLWPRDLVTWFPWEMTAQWAQVLLQLLGVDTPGVDPLELIPLQSTFIEIYLIFKSQLVARLLQAILGTRLL